ncbi:protein kinase superfamily protein [Abortiporus biennis]
MPPGPAFNWLCVATSVAEIVSNAAQIKASQLASRTIPLAVARSSTSPSRKRRKLEDVSSSLSHRSEEQGDITDRYTKEEEDHPTVQDEAPPTSQDAMKHVHLASEPSLPVSSALRLKPSPNTPTHSAAVEHVKEEAQPEDLKVAVESEREKRVSETEYVYPPIGNVLTAVAAQNDSKAQGEAMLASEGAEAKEDSLADAEVTSLDPAPARQLQSSKVPSSRLGRLFHYGGLAASLGYGAASELLRRSTSSESNNSSSLMMTEGNIKRLVSKLTKMRGAALKIGQFMSIQDSHVLPPEVENIFRRVQDSAHYMPDWQMEQVMQSSLGPNWQDYFESFDRLPFAAASIGQVHSAVLAASSSPTGKAVPVAVKIQFPNIVNSIESDISYIKLLLTAGKLLPKGLFLDRTIEVMKSELADECDYAREASFLRKFGESAYLGNDPWFKVPWVWEGSTDRVLVMERVDGVSVGGNVINRLTQTDRDDIATRIIDLCLKELFVFRLMQTDPNWTNFLWNGKTRQVELVDFGATREYTKSFIDNWLHLLQAAASDDRDSCIHWSHKLGYLTGEENEIMLDAHVKSMTLLATPFKETTPQPFYFGPGSSWAGITNQIRDQIPFMLQHRLTPPPRETYSLNRKLSGAFLLAARLDAKVDCKKLWVNVVKGYKFDDELDSNSS